MLIHFDYSSLTARVVSGVLKTSHTQRVYVSTFADGVATALPAGASISIKLKPRAERDTSNLVATATFAISGSETSLYVSTVDAYTAASVDLFNLANSDVTDDLAAYPCDLVVLYRTSDAIAWVDAEESSTMEIDFLSAINLPTDTPTASLTNSVFTPLTALTGGAAGSLDGLVTAGGVITTSASAFVVVSNVFSAWQLRAGTTAENSANGIVRPDDYNASTNARIWVQMI